MTVNTHATELQDTNRMITYNQLKIAKIGLMIKKVTN